MSDNDLKDLTPDPSPMRRGGDQFISTENLKCCGNCSYNHDGMYGNRCKLYDKRTSPSSLCDSWKYDGFVSDEREDL